MDMASVEKRQTTYINPDGSPARGYDSWWYDTREGSIAKWSIFFGLLFLFFAFIIGGRWHAMRRIKKGLKPLSYHRWLLSRRQRALYDPAYREPQVYYAVYPPGQQPNTYNMYPMPPPVYDPHSAPPPNYQPPPGASKIDPGQAGQTSGVTQSIPSQSTGASNNPYRQ